MTRLYLIAGLFVFAVVAALLAMWLGGGWVPSLILLAFILAFAGTTKVSSVIDTILKLSGMGSQ
jgi:hypothetical protein